MKDFKVKRQPFVATVVTLRQFWIILTVIRAVFGQFGVNNGGVYSTVQRVFIIKPVAV